MTTQKCLPKSPMMKTSHYTFECGSWIDCLSFLVENKWHHYYSHSLAESLALHLVRQRLAALIFYSVGSQIIVKKNAKDMI